jgi:hypothetical protein
VGQPICLWIWKFSIDHAIYILDRVWLVVFGKENENVCMRQPTLLKLNDIDSRNYFHTKEKWICSTNVEHCTLAALTRTVGVLRLVNAMTHNKKEEITFTAASTDSVKRD